MRSSRHDALAEPIEAQPRRPRRFVGGSLSIRGNCSIADIENRMGSIRSAGQARRRDMGRGALAGLGKSRALFGDGAVFFIGIHQPANGRCTSILHATSQWSPTTPADGRGPLLFVTQPALAGEGAVVRHVFVTDPFLPPGACFMRKEGRNVARDRDHGDCRRFRDNLVPHRRRIQHRVRSCHSRSRSCLQTTGVPHPSSTVSSWWAWRRLRSAIVSVRILWSSVSPPSPSALHAVGHGPSWGLPSSTSSACGAAQRDLDRRRYGNLADRTLCHSLRRWARCLLAWALVGASARPLPGPWPAPSGLAAALFVATPWVAAQSLITYVGRAKFEETLESSQDFWWNIQFDLAVARLLAAFVWALRSQRTSKRSNSIAGPAWGRSCSRYRRCWRC